MGKLTLTPKIGTTPFEEKWSLTWIEDDGDILSLRPKVNNDE